MKAPWSGQLSPVATGWLFALVFFGLIAFLFVPAPKPEPKPLAPPVKPAPSRLVALGLPDNPDLEHLPEFFAVYAEHAEWKEDKTIFAYWNPGSNSYSYFFEATRVNRAYRFKGLPQLADIGEETDLSASSDPRWAESLPDQGPIRFIYTSRNVFPYDESRSSVGWYVKFRSRELSVVKKTKAEIGLAPIVQPPPPELKLSPWDLEKKK